MDDRELEARLRTRLHSRFADAQVPPDLATSVRQALTTTPRRVAFDLRAGGLRFGWSAVAAVAALVGAAVVVANLAGPTGPGNRPSASPAPSAAAERHFIVLPPAGTPSKPESILASDVLGARMRALGIGNFSSGGGYAIQFTVPADGPSGHDVRIVLAATGDVQFVPLPPADYGEGTRTAVVGEPLPKHEPALFGWEGIESVAMDATNGQPALAIKLKPAAKAAFAGYTASHVLETFAIVIDGRVALLPIINEPIASGEVTVSGTQFDDGAFARAAAILVGGMLPEAWRGAVVPEIDPKEAAVSRAMGWVPTATVESVDLDAVPDGAGWRAVWVVVLTGDLGDLGPLCSTPGPAASPCLATADSARLTLDALSGEIVSFEAPAP